jgi:hypothetical protein
MRKNFDQIKVLLLALFLFISPALWMVLANMPQDFQDKQSWFYLMTFITLAFAVFIALDSARKK